MSFGSQTVTFVTVAEAGSPGYLGVKSKTRTEVAVSGCRFRPLDAKETPDYVTDVATVVWKCTAPPVAAAIAAASTGELKVDGVTYQIVGAAKPYPDMSGAPYKVTIFCQRQT